jgi:predicted secreted protein
MKKNLKLIGQGLSFVLFVMMLSACSQADVTSTSQPSADATQSVSTAKNSATKGEPAKEESGTIAQAPTAPKIATFQTQQRSAGFSPDGQHFLNLESWRDQGAGIPHAALQIVNLADNTCVASGCLRTQFTEAQAGQSIESAENNLLQKTQQLRQDLQLAAPTPGEPLPVISRSRTADGTESVTVRLQNNQPLSLTLKQKRVLSGMAGGQAEKDQAAMQLEVRYAGKTQTLGSLDQMQDWMMDFSIREVRQAPTGDTIAILITGAERAFEGTLGRTIVQGIKLNN